MSKPHPDTITQIQIWLLKRSPAAIARGLFRWLIRFYVGEFIRQAVQGFDKYTVRELEAEAPADVVASIYAIRCGNSVDADWQQVFRWATAGKPGPATKE